MEHENIFLLVPYLACRIMGNRATFHLSMPKNASQGSEEAIAWRKLCLVCSETHAALNSPPSDERTSEQGVERMPPMKPSARAWRGVPK